jgi:uncharacterized spore protein YtfJ
METKVQELLDTIAELKEKADVNAAFGEATTVEGRTIIPVARVGYGFGLGFGYGLTLDDETDDDENKGEDESEATGEASGGGGGGAAQAHPLAVIEVTADGTRVEPIVNEQKLALGGLLLIAWGIFWAASTLIAIFITRMNVRLSEKD